MELRFIVEHAKASVDTASKLFSMGDRDRCEVLLEDLGIYLTKQFKDGVKAPPNIDLKPNVPVTE